MFQDFQRPRDGWLCGLSILWILIGLAMAVRFGLNGNFIGAVVMLVFALAAAGLWFQSRIAAVVLILIAVVGTVYSLFHFGQVPIYRIGWRVAFAVWTIWMLVVYLNEQKQS